MELMEFGKRLLSLLNNLVSENEMVQKGNKTYEHAKELILEIKSSFNCSQKQSIR